MAYVFCKHDSVQLDLMVKKELWPKLVGHIGRCNCTYKKEKEISHEGEDTWIKVIDVTAAHEYELGWLIGLIYSMEWDSVTEGKLQKFYIMLHPRKRKKGAKKNVCENRPETGKGSEGGIAGESGDIQSRPDYGSC